MVHVLLWASVNAESKGNLGVVTKFARFFCFKIICVSSIKKGEPGKDGSQLNVLSLLPELSETCS